MKFRSRHDDPRQEGPADALQAATDRAMPSVARGRSTGDRLVTLLGAGMALMLGVHTFNMLSESRQPASPPALAIAPAHADDDTGLPEAPEPNPVVQPAPVPATPKPVETVARTRDPDRARAPVLVVDLGSGAPAATATQTVAETKPAGTAASGKMTDEEQFALRLGGQSYDTATAHHVGALDTLVVQGTVIPAVLETGINTDLPGYVRALVNQDVTSFDGSRVLIPRGARLVGQYRSGLSVGQTRAYVLWTRLLRPDGVSVDIASPGVDGNGQTGLAGDVNSHFFKRFGSAILMTVVGGASAALGDSADVVIGASQGAESAAGIALQQNAGIPPTITVPAGTPVRVITARDLDFSAVDGTGAK
ncbi:MAG: type VI secretion protein [Alphaproteobacteria bacterium]|nr:MAG: type VI secretion protein [Alphaproteobacteria bacterium]